MTFYGRWSSCPTMMGRHLFTYVSHSNAVERVATNRLRLQDRCRAFRHIVRQYRTILMMKCAGRGHDSSGVAGTAQGELALRCRSCPQPGRNLPDGWDRINWAAMPEDLRCVVLSLEDNLLVTELQRRFKYFLFLAQDCNFRLINRNVSSAANDPILGDVYGYFVNNAKYAEYISTQITEAEISSCLGFQAMFLANRKHVKGLRTTGVGGITCVHHNMWCPNRIGNLQLGERCVQLMRHIFCTSI
jgi:hypothetical protein